VIGGGRRSRPLPPHAQLLAREGKAASQALLEPSNQQPAAPTLTHERRKSLDDLARHYITLGKTCTQHTYICMVFWCDRPQYKLSAMTCSIFCNCFAPVRAAFWPALKFLV
jgi:hypothetical protein